jgi:hypothetical protein
VSQCYEWCVTRPFRLLGVVSRSVYLPLCSPVIWRIPSVTTVVIASPFRAFVQSQSTFSEVLCPLLGILFYVVSWCIMSAESLYNDRLLRGFGRIGRRSGLCCWLPGVLVRSHGPDATTIFHPTYDHHSPKTR